MFAHEIEVQRQDIGVPDIHLAGFTELTGPLEQAVKARQSGLDGHTKTRASMESALMDGMAAVRTLDAVIPLMLADDPVTLAVWERDRRIEQGRRGRRAGRPVAGLESAVPEVAAPPPVDDPALKVAS